MQVFIDLILKTGKSVIDLCFYKLIPIMVIMMAFMRLLEKKRILHYIAWILSPVLIIFGLPGLGLFAFLQIFFISFAAPMATLALMDKDSKIGNRTLASTLALVYTVSQANAAFPLVAYGLNLPITLISSVLGGIVAASSTFYFFAKKESHFQMCFKESYSHMPKSDKKNWMKILIEGGEEGVQIVLKSIPMLMLALFLVKILGQTGFIDWLSNLLSPAFSKVGLRGAVVLPIATKFFAGGTAMMGTTIDLINAGKMSALELNKIAGLMINPFDLVGLVFYAAAGPRVAKVVKFAFKGALLGILFRTIFHFIIF